MRERNTGEPELAGAPAEPSPAVAVDHAAQAPRDVAAPASPASAASPEPGAPVAEPIVTPSPEPAHASSDATASPADATGERTRPRARAGSVDGRSGSTARTEAKDRAAPAAKAAATRGGASLDDVLDDVTGGVPDEPGAARKRAAEAPKKEGLDRSDVAAAMGAVQDRAKACQEKEDAVGTVQIKFTVDPSGRVAKASATGKYAGTPTGACVAAAVKSAAFPSWDGGPMTFTFPFLLSQ
jgi:hypothetical protein